MANQKRKNLYMDSVTTTSIQGVYEKGALVQLHIFKGGKISEDDAKRLIDILERSGETELPPISGFGFGFDEEFTNLMQEYADTVKTDGKHTGFSIHLWDYRELANKFGANEGPQAFEIK